MRSLSIDYSEDELDALADLFGVPALGSARLRRPAANATAEAVLRATLATATRSLVARRAMVLSGTAIAPKVELLEPHATLLETFLGATTVVAVQRRAKAGTERWVVFVRADVAVEQRAVAGRAIVRMTAHPAEALDALVTGPLQLGEATADPGADPFEVSAAAFERGPDELWPEAPEAVRALVYARRATIDATVVRHHEQAVERTALRWLDAGELGLWRVEPDGSGATARVSPTSAPEALRELTAAYGGAA